MRYSKLLSGGALTIVKSSKTCQLFLLCNVLKIRCHSDAFALIFILWFVLCHPFTLFLIHSLHLMIKFYYCYLVLLFYYYYLVFFTITFSYYYYLVFYYYYIVLLLFTIKFYYTVLLCEVLQQRECQMKIQCLL